MLTGAFDSTGVSQAFTITDPLRGGFDIALSMTGANSVTLERLFGSTWFTWGSAMTATTAQRIQCGASASTWRFNVGTFDTADIVPFVDGNYVPGPGTLAIQA